MSQEYMGTAISQKELGQIAAKRRPLSYYTYAFGKRTFDIAGSLCAMVLLAPVFLFLSAVIFAMDPGRVIYGHERLGKGGKKIKIWKFRSMYQNADEIFDNFTEEQKAEFYRDFKLDNDPRITPVGNFLRKSSLDELPQLWNIFCGDLSFVGPRPIVEEELVKYGGESERLLSVKPGLTGYWQANGRNLIGYENGRREMELYYVENRSALLDFKIMLKTFGTVVQGKGAQ